MTEPALWRVEHTVLRETLTAAPEAFVTAMTHGTMRFLLFAPSWSDTQQPHRQDELYIVSRGSGWFVRGGERQEFRTGDALFVPAGMAHRFEEFTPDFETWVIFWGPAGGEATAPILNDVAA